MSDLTTKAAEIRAGLEGVVERHAAATPATMDCRAWHDIGLLLALAAELAEARGRAATDAIKRIAEVADAVGWQAGVGASETAGLIVSVLAANPEHVARFMNAGSELFIDGTMRAENGCLSHLAMNGEVISPTKLRSMKGISQ